jgi:hypothetical protein
VSWKKNFSRSGTVFCPSIDECCGYTPLNNLENLAKLKIIFLVGDCQAELTPRRKKQCLKILKNKFSNRGAKNNFHKDNASFRCVKAFWG